VESEPAFPVTREELVSYADGRGQVPLPVSYAGLTKREWFAGQAFEWSLRQPYPGDDAIYLTGREHIAVAASIAVQAADALIAALEPKT